MTRRRNILVICPLVTGRTERLDIIKAEQLAGAEFPPELEFTFRACRLSAPVWDNFYDFALSDMATLEAGLDAQKEGFAAVCIETITDAGLEPLRSALDIPVIAAGQASYLTALHLGRKFSVLVVWEGFRLAHERSLRLHGLLDHCASIRDLGMRPEEVNFANMFGGREEEYYERMAEAGARAIREDGADVIVLGSTTMYKARRYLSKRLPVPVVDPATALYKHAEALLALGLTHSRTAYPAVGMRKTRVTHAMLDAVDELRDGITAADG